MNIEEALREQWLSLRERLQARHLLGADDASLSLRIPGPGAIWFGAAGDAKPRRATPSEPVPGQASMHAAVYAARADVGAIAIGGGDAGRCLVDFGGALPQAFDEQARHLGPMGPATANVAGVFDPLAGGGNVLLVQGRVVCLGMTATRLALNAELFEKCAKAYVLAVASGGRVRPLPWLVRYIANRRLRRDERHARQRFAQGLLPEEAKGY